METLPGFVLSTTTAVSNSCIRTILSHVDVNGLDLWVAGDRNNYIHTYSFEPSTKTFTRIASFKAHSDAISHLAYMAPCPWFPHGCLLSSSFDKTICAWDLSEISSKSSTNVQPILTLIGHNDKVCHVTTVDNKIISSSWDHTSRIWSSPTEYITLAHENHSILCTVPVDDGYITLGADKTLRVWSLTGQLLFKLDNAHDDVLRDGLYRPETCELITVANDGQLKSWLYDSSNHSLEEVASVKVSDRYLYCLSALNTDYIVSGEDNAVYIVSTSLTHPADMIPVSTVCWASGVLSNGDIIAGSEDGFVRTFTLSSDRRASEELETQYFASLADITINDPQIAAMNPLDIPDVNTLYEGGHYEKNSYTAVLVRRPSRTPGCPDDRAIFAWNKGYQKWIECGTITTNKGSQSQKVTSPDGKQWDFCFDVDVEGRGYLPLYCNYDSDPWLIARDFLIKNGIPNFQLDPLVAQIRKAMGGHHIQEQKKSSVSLFPMNQPVFFSKNFVSSAINFIKKSLKVSESQINSLSNIQSLELLTVCSELFDQYSCASWPAMDILRVAILEPGARRTLDPEKLIQFLQKVSTVEMDENLMLVFFRILSNLFQNYIDEAENELNILDIISSFVPKFGKVKETIQMAFITALLNFSIYMSKSKDVKTTEKIANMLLTITSEKVDEETLYRELFTMGNVAANSLFGKEILKGGYDAIVSLDNGSERIHTVIVALSDLLVDN